MLHSVLTASGGRAPPASLAGATAAQAVRARCSSTLVQASAEPWTVVGAGRVGDAIAKMGGGADAVIRRGQAIEGPPGPIVVCTRNDVLDDIVSATPEDRRADLVFIQNGMLQPWLDSKGLGENTQVLVYFAVAAMGDPPKDGVTDLNPEGLTAAYGPHAASVASRLTANGLSCKVLDRPEFTKCMLEKLIWISAFMLVGARHECTVGEVESEHKAEVVALIDELGARGAVELGVQLDAGYPERLCAYARSVAHFPTAVKEFEWRNGWFFDITNAEVDAGRADPFPTHTAWLQELGVV